MPNHYLEEMPVYSVCLTLELCVAAEEDLPFAVDEAKKMAAEVRRLRQNLILSIITRKAESPMRAEVNWDGGTATVLNENAKSKSHQCLLVTEQTVKDKNGTAIAGLAGPNKGWLSKPVLKAQGEDSVQSVIHEWLHTISHLTKIDPDRAAEYGFQNCGKVWINQLGQEFNQFVLFQLPPNEA